MSDLYIFRKVSDPAPKLSATKIRQALDSIHETARVNRDDLSRFMLGGGFGKLPVTKQSVIDSDESRRAILGQGWKIPQECLGRVGEATMSSKESMRLWIKKNLVPFGIDPDSVAVVLVD